MAEPVPASVRVTVAYAPQPRQVEEVTLELPAGSTVQEALHRSGLVDRYPELAHAALEIGVWGKLVPDPAHTRLQAHDRVEVYRPLRVDPKFARRERFKGQGARTTGLFARKREGAKAGYGG